MLVNDASGSVIRETRNGEVKDIAYSAFGYAKPADSDVGYNGEVRDQHTEGYILGNGYRVFSPKLMRFCGPDSWSPFGPGGRNTYSYVANNPITNTDPSGHMVRGLASAFSNVVEEVPTSLPPRPAARSMIRDALREARDSLSVPAREAVSEAGTLATSSKTLKGTSDSAGKPSGLGSEALPSRPISERPPMPLPKPALKTKPSSTPKQVSWLSQPGDELEAWVHDVNQYVDLPQVSSTNKVRTSKGGTQGTSTTNSNTKNKSTSGTPTRAAKPKESAADKVKRIRAEKGRFQSDQ